MATVGVERVRCFTVAQFQSRQMIGNSQTHSAPKGRVTAGGLSAQQRSLVELMQRHQFGRIENMAVQGGQPVLGLRVKVIQVAHFGSRNASTPISSASDFELKSQVLALFARLGSLPDGTEVKLEFKHGLPFSIEIVHVVGVV